MPRSSSRSSSSGRSSAPAPRAAPRAAAPSKPAAPAPVAHASSMPPAMPQQSGGMLSGLGRTIAEGMAFGTGSAIAHRAVGAIANSFGGSSSEAAAPAPAAPVVAPIAQSRGADCSQFQKDFMQCLQENKSDIASCQMYVDNLQQCQADARLY